MSGKLLKIMFLFFTVVLCGALLLACAPQFGKAGKDNRTLQSPNYHNGKFHNLSETSVGAFDGKMLKALGEYVTGGQIREPEEVIPTVPVDASQIGQAEGLRVTWLGHSTSLIEIDGLLILTDPVFADRASPFSFLGPKRFKSELPITPGQLPDIDAVLISHDHYDHLAYRSILALKDKVETFFVPLGVAGHLERWGIDKNKIVEFDWWQQHKSGSLKFVFTPTRHFSGRGLTRNKTLWGSWVIEGDQGKLFFSGDSGYFDGFKTIGDKYGPFDVTLLESGAYNDAWADIHMMPEQTVQAHIDLQGKLLLPIHWGKFNLSLHAWTEPVERLLAAAQKADVRVTTPQQGEMVAMISPPDTRWWAEVAQKEGQQSLAATVYE